MKIAIISDALATGGAERQCSVSAVALANHGHEVHLLTYYERNDFADFLSKNNVHWRYVPANGRTRLSRVSALTDYLQGKDFDVAHAFKATSSVYGRMAAKRAGIGCIFGGFRAQFSQGFLTRHLNRIISRNTAGWIVNSEGCKRTVVQDFKAPPEKVFVVRNGIYIEDFQSQLSVHQAREKFGITGDLPVVIIVAKIIPRKNHEMFVRVAARAVKAGHKANFLIVGEREGEHHNVVESLIRSEGVGDYVRLLGRSEEIADLLQVADVAMLTSRSDGEGLPNALIEAGAAGVPVVSTRNGAEEVVLEGQTGHVVDVDDDETMCAKLIGLMENSDLRRQMGEHAAKHVAETLSVEAMYKNLMATHETGLAGG